MQKKILLVGESWTSTSTHVKGFDQFATATWHTGVVISRGKRTSGEYFMAHYNLTPRVKVLADRLLAQKSTLCTEHATTLNALDGDIAGVPAAVKPARRFYELMRQLPLTISADELIVGNQTRKPHGAIFHDENAPRRPSAFQFLNLNNDLDSPGSI